MWSAVKKWDTIYGIISIENQMRSSIPSNNLKYTGEFREQTAKMVKNLPQAPQKKWESIPILSAKGSAITTIVMIIWERYGMDHRKRYVLGWVLMIQ